MSRTITESYTGRCGTSTGYSDHYKRKTPPCQPCRDARAEHQRSYTKRLILNRGQKILVDGLGTRRRLQALSALGYSTKELGKHLNVHASQIGLFLKKERVYPQTAERVMELYEKLSGTPGTSARARSRAIRLGFAPPLAWDDIDDPREVPVTEIDRAHAEALQVHKTRRATERRSQKRAAA